MEFKDKSIIHNSYDLSCQFDRRKSFYSKARIEEYEDKKNNRIIGHSLFSYNTEIAYYDLQTNRIKVLYKIDTSTTARHFREFCKQHGFDNVAKLPLSKIKKLYKKEFGQGDSYEKIKSM